MSKIFAVAIGGAIGSVGRYLIALGIERFGRSSFPYETLTANLLGCLLIGLLWGYFEKVPLSNEFRLFLFTGVLGGFTTFSTFARENVQFLKSGAPLHAVAYLLVSNLFGLLLVAIGFIISMKFFRAERFL
ncbi:MAG: fluoride efflux transporter CrcB [Desulfobulbaceae bacterium]|nr:MAG: fluoride efflux transporter CrcB [Desulfobulbaceae bacterium]